MLFSINKRRYYRLAHRVVAELFIPNPHNLPEVNHKDGNKLNNNVSNLEWCTTRQNQIHCRDFLKNKNHKITYDIAQKIRMDKEETGMSHRDLSKKYGISKTHIGYILSGKRWTM